MKIVLPISCRFGSEIAFHPYQVSIARSEHEFHEQVLRLVGEPAIVIICAMFDKIATGSLGIHLKCKVADYELPGILGDTFLPYFKLHLFTGFLIELLNRLYRFTEFQHRQFLKHPVTVG